MAKKIHEKQLTARMKMFDRGNTLAKKFINSVRPVVCEHSNSAELVGTCVLITIDGRYFALTAAHVADWQDVGLLTTACSNDSYYLPRFHTSDAKGNRTNDKLDIAFCELPANLAVALGDCKFLTTSDVDVDDQGASGRFYTFIGYPIKHQNLDADRMHFDPQTTIFSGLELSDGQYSKAGYPRYSHVAVNFDQTKVVTPQGIKALVKQHGISGGAIFRFDSVLAHDAADQLVAITIYSQWAGTKFVVGTRIALFFEALRKRFPELSSKLPVCSYLKVEVSEADPEAQT